MALAVLGPPALTLSVMIRPGQMALIRRVRHEGSVLVVPVRSRQNSGAGPKRRCRTPPDLHGDLSARVNHGRDRRHRWPKSLRSPSEAERFTSASNSKRRRSEWSAPSAAAADREQVQAALSTILRVEHSTQALNAGGVICAAVEYHQDHCACGVHRSGVTAIPAARPDVIRADNAGPINGRSGGDVVDHQHRT